MATMLPTSDGEPTPKPKTLRRRLRLVLISTCVTLGMGELCLRTLMFSKNETIAEFAKPLRRPKHFASMQDDHLWWQLDRTFAIPGKRSEPARPDSTVGWVNNYVEPETFTHSSQADLQGRRPVLLFGDSYAACVADVPCWEELLEESDMSSEHLLLNYGAGGYGFDQIVLSMTRAIEHYADQNPVVMISLMVDGDMDRSNLRFRGWPKSHMVPTDDGGLELDSGSLPATSVEYLIDNPPSSYSYLLRWFMFSSGIWTDSEASSLIRFGRLQEEKELLNRRLIELAMKTCEERNLEYVFVLFNSRPGVSWPVKAGWPNQFIRDALEELEAPYVCANTDLLNELASNGSDLDDYYILEGRSRNHYNERGNRIILNTLKRGIRKQYDRPGDQRDLPPWKLRKSKSKGSLRFEQGLTAEYASPEDEKRLVAMMDPELPTVFTFKLDGRASSFSAIAKSFRGKRGRAPLTLTIRLDSETVFNKKIGANTRVEPIELDLAGAREMTIRIAQRKSTKEPSPGLYLASPKLLWTTESK